MKDLIERLRNGYPSKERLEAADAIHALNTENTRLTECLRIANNNHEEFERKWYLATDENAQLKAELAAMREQKPIGYASSFNGNFDGRTIRTIKYHDESAVYAAPGANHVQG